MANASPLCCFLLCVVLLYIVSVSSFSGSAGVAQARFDRRGAGLKPDRKYGQGTSKWTLHVEDSKEGDAHASKKSLEEIKKQANRNWDFDPTLAYEEQSPDFRKGHAGYIEDWDGPMFIGTHRIGEDPEKDEYYKYLVSEFEYLYSCVQRGKYLSIRDFLKWPPVQELVKTGPVKESGVENLWVEIVGSIDAQCDLPKFTAMFKGLSLDKKVDPEKVAIYCLGEFSNLCDFATGYQYKPKEIPFELFLEWNEIKEILAEGFVSHEQVEEVWKEICGRLENPAHLQSFLEVNDRLDEIAC